MVHPDKDFLPAFQIIFTGNACQNPSRADL